jgi:flagellar export protein FliJ
MSERNRIHQLSQLVELREREADRLAAEMASKVTVRDRYRASVAKLDELFFSSGPTGAQMTPGGQQTLSPLLSLNCGGYKQTVMQIAAAHRVDLSLHESEVALAQRLALEAARRREALGQVLDRQRRQVAQARKVREQKRHDDLAIQVWSRGRR